MSEFDTADLIERIRTHGQIPNTGEWTDQKLLDLATEQIRDVLVPELLRMREDYLDEVQDYAWTVDSFRIPARAVGSQVLGVYYVAPDCHPILLDRLSDTQLQAYAKTDSRPAGFYLRGPSVVTVPAPQSSSTGSVRIKFMARPAALGSPTGGAIVGPGTAGTGVVSVTSVVGLTAGLKYDVIRGQSPFETVATGQTITTPGGNTIGGLSAGVEAQLLAGDVFCPTGTSSFIQLPADYLYALAHLVAAQFAQDVGQLDEAKVQMDAAFGKLGQMRPLITTRGGASVRKIQLNSSLVR